MVWSALPAGENAGPFCTALLGVPCLRNASPGALRHDQQLSYSPFVRQSTRCSGCLNIYLLDITFTYRQTLSFLIATLQMLRL